MPMQIQPKQLNDVLKYEAPVLYSREAVPLAIAAQGSLPIVPLPLGTVLGRRADGVYVQLDAAANDGAQTAAAVLIGETYSVAVQSAVIVVRHAVVAREALAWPDGLTEAHRTAALAQLEARGIVARESA